MVHDLNHSVTAQDTNAFRISPGGFFPPGEGYRPLPVTQKPAFPRSPGPQHSRALFLFSAPPPSLFTHPASNLRTQIPFPPYQKPARDWPLARISRAFWFPPRSDLSSTLSFLPYPQATFSLPKPLTSPTWICTWRSQGAKPQAPPRVSLPSWRWQKQGWTDSCCAGQNPRVGRSLFPLPTSPIPPSRLLNCPYRQDEYCWVPNPRFSSGSCRE